MSDFWKTSISRVRPNEILVRGYPIEQLTRHCSFGEVVYLLLTGDLPKGNEGRLVEAILVSCCEHSLAAPSADAVRFVASSGVPLQTAVAAGISAIGDVHGGAIEPCAKILQRAAAEKKSGEAVLRELKTAGQRMPGYGHPVHSNDPRTAVLLALADEWKLAGKHTRLGKEIEDATVKVMGRRLPMNVDGAIAALMCDLKMAPALGKAFFIISRAPGYIAHAHEQMTQEKPFKAARHEEIAYTGPARRDVLPVPSAAPTPPPNAPEL
ncbi:MAG: citryl-CoA lyase [Verrucomicrobia bacterium]|nr:citryl-CoA lyase [Verrucomicrobiota bacterium]